MASVIDNLSLKKALRKKIFNKWINITAHAFLRHGYKLKKKHTLNGVKIATITQSKRRTSYSQNFKFQKNVNLQLPLEHGNKNSLQVSYSMYVLKGKGRKVSRELYIVKSLLTRLSTLTIKTTIYTFQGSVLSPCPQKKNPSVI